MIRTLGININKYSDDEERERKEISGYISLIYKKFISLDINLIKENLDEINEVKSLMSSQDQLEFGISDATQ